MPNQYTNDPRTEQITCAICGTVFTGEIRRKRKYCSNHCRGVANAGNIRRKGGEAYTTACKWCGAALHASPSIPRRFCNLQCYGQWQSVHRVGENNPMTGRSQPRPKNMVTLQCVICGADFTEKACYADVRKCCSRACAAKHKALTTRGAQSVHWRGGGIKDYGASWNAARRFVRARDKVCQHCGAAPKPGYALDVHHIVPFRRFAIEQHEEANSPANLIALCRSCHMRVERTNDIY